MKLICEPFLGTTPKNTPLQLPLKTFLWTSFVNHPQNHPIETTPQNLFVNLIFLGILNVTDDTDTDDKPDTIRTFTT